MISSSSPSKAKERYSIGKRKTEQAVLDEEEV